MNRIWLSLSVAGLLALGLFVAAGAQMGEFVQLVRPVVVDVEQAVPVELVLALPVNDADVMTVTTPLTVNVGLRVVIEGPQVVTVTMLPADEPVVSVGTVAENEAHSGDGGPRPVMGDVAWEVVSAVDSGDTYDEDDNFRAVEANGGELLAVVFSAENMGTRPVDLIVGDYQDTIGDIQLEDDAGRRFAVASGSYGSQCDWMMTAQPGIPLECTLVFEVPDAGAELSAIFIDTEGAEVGALDLP